MRAPHMQCSIYGSRGKPIRTLWIPGNGGTHTRGRGGYGGRKKRIWKVPLAHNQRRVERGICSKWRRTKESIMKEMFRERTTGGTSTPY